MHKIIGPSLDKSTIHWAVIPNMQQLISKLNNITGGLSTTP